MSKATIEVDNIFCYFKADDPELPALFYKSLRFRSKGYIFSPQYQRFRRTKGKSGWDGYTCFFTKAGRFGTGLLPEVIKGLRNLGVDVEVIDKRRTLDYGSLSLDTFPDKPLRDYQIELGNLALAERRGIIKAATGAGKTLLFCGLLKCLSEKTPTVVLFRSRTLVNQTFKVFTSMGLENVGRVHMDYFEPNIITCSTIQSIHRLAPLIPKIRAVVVDECHEYTSNLSVKTLRAFTGASLILGFSATPFDRADKVQKYTLKSLIGPILGEVSTKELQDRDILAESRIKIIPIRKPSIPHALFEEAYTRGVTENEYRNKKVAQIVGLHPNSKILILVEKIDHGDNLRRYLPQAHWIHGSTEEEERDQAAATLKTSGQQAVVIASRIWAQGVDIPEIEVLINASGGRSERSAIQKLGRGLRKAEGKDYLDFYDFYDDTNRYLEAHSKERIKTYKREGHEMSMLELPDDSV